MDIRWKRWINSIGVAIVIVVMTVAGIVGLNQGKDLALSGQFKYAGSQGEFGEYLNDVKSTMIYRMLQNKKMVSSEEEIQRNLVEPIQGDLPEGMQVHAQLNYKTFNGKNRKENITYGKVLNEKKEAKKEETVTIKKKGKGALTTLSEYIPYRIYEDNEKASYTLSGNNLQAYQSPNSLFINEDNEVYLESGKITISYNQSYLTRLETYYSLHKNSVMDSIDRALVCIGIEVVGTILLVLLFAFQKKRTRFFAGVDRVWYEVIFAVGLVLASLAATIVSGVLTISELITKLEEDMISLDVSMVAAYVGTFIIILLLAVCIQTTVWRIKEKKFLDSTLCLGYFIRFRKRDKELKAIEYQAMPFGEKRVHDLAKIRKTVRGFLIGFLFIGFMFLFFGSGLLLMSLCMIGLCIGAWIWIGHYNETELKKAIDEGKLTQQIQAIAEGDLLAKTDISEESPYYAYTKQLENIGEGMEKSIAKQLKGERMKIDLITNVSHDLKTPLTSMIGYIDLLARDNTLSDEAKDYVNILNQKSEHLRNMISDLFELAKSTSGEAKVDLEEMDMERLFQQTLGDMNDQIEESGFNIRYENKAENTQFMGDANRMYRVVQNVIENALKYSLKGTRIFVNISEKDDKVQAEIINTASYEMNFTEDEIVERFARGEKSRTTEGNGLGLSIADSFTKNCGGEFAIFVAGDQFKVVIEFTKVS